MKIATVGVFSLLCLLNAARGKAADHDSTTLQGNLEALQGKLEALQGKLASQDQLEAVERQIKTLDQQLSDIGEQLICFVKQQKEKDIDQRLKILEEEYKAKQVPATNQANQPKDQPNQPKDQEEDQEAEEVPAKVPAKDSDSDSDSIYSYDSSDSQYKGLIKLIDTRLRKMINDPTSTTASPESKTENGATVDPTSTTASPERTTENGATGCKGLMSKETKYSKDLSRKTAAILGSTITLSICIVMVLLWLFVYRLRADQLQGSNMK